MADYAAVRIDDIEGIVGGAFKRARGALGVTSFGMQVLDFPPGADGHPEHDHAEEGQEEVFVVLRGGGEISVDGETVALGPDTLVRVGPTARRKIVAGPDGMRLLALGGVPGSAYTVKDFTEIGAPDPFSRR